MTIRWATLADAEAIARLVNRAYEVERFFVEGDRTSVEAVRQELRSGAFLLVERPDGSLGGCVHVAVEKGRGTFGMLAVDPDDQKRGIGAALVRAAEAYARAHGATAMDIAVVNVRADLLPYYARLGYAPVGTAPYVHRPVTQPVHFVMMAKEL